ncbi:putative bifunctional diguanylate cyclase/phosphodiesterase [Cryptosporangium phraense]|uniref:GGDEF domain-containing protein n=1 Tax=Cryptosporangium phraense TaxID=2593070 RepID=A0A545AY73_9ACTN|nr:bifunctional diguanylate cyclase/phosphodiesterase [Cryptosporangium phraense]TQS46289.1 GGDEF domain-containing protein [Cryptosporangium phraense]
MPGKARWWVATLVGVVLYEWAAARFGSGFYPFDRGVLVGVVGWMLVRYTRASREATGRLRTARRLGAAAAALWLGAIAWNLAADLAGVPEKTQTVVYALASLLPAACGVAAMVTLPVAPPTTLGKLRLVLDGLIAAFSMLALVWLFVLKDWYASHGGGADGVTLMVLCIVLIVVAAMALILLANGSGRQVTALTGLAVGLGLIAIAMLLQLASILQGSGWLWGNGLLQLGVLVLGATARLPFGAPVRDRDSTTLASHALPYLPLAGMIVVVMGDQVRDGSIDMLVAWLALSAVVAVLGRQFVSLRMTASLNREIDAHRARLAHQAFHDPLTGLANRALFGERLASALSDGSGPALLLVDLDGFKAVNDTRGHAAGDQLLVAVAGRLKGAVRATDTVARLGGDEFAVVLPGAAEPSAAIAVASLILQRVGEPVSLSEGAPVAVRASVGIALADGESTAELLLRDADLALYEAKESGKNRYQVADPELSRSTLGRLQLEEELRAGLEAGEFEVHYQPIVELESERITAVEALLRWRHPVRGLLGPGAFLEAAEAAGILPALDGVALRAACRQVSEWRSGRPDFVVSVNICAAHLVDPGLAAEVTAALGSVPASALMLEVTETALVADLAMAARSLRELADLGVRIALDDFGTGYSSLTYLRTLPIDAIKIDGSFVRDLDGNATDEAVTRAILGLAETLGLRPVAEGVEGESQAERLRDLRCGHAQGFLFARPMPAAEVSRLLASPAVSVA